MIYLEYLLVAAILVLLFIQWHMAAKAKRIEGLPVPNLEPAIDDKLRERGRVLLYFFSPACGPCRVMTPRIDRLACRYDNIFKLDVSRSLDIARRLGVMATPTTVLLSEGRIAAVNLGALSEQSLEKLLA